MKRTIRKINMVRRLYPCRHCHATSKRHCIATRKVKCLRHDLIIRYSKHYCVACETYTGVNMSEIVDWGSHYSHKVKRRVIELKIFTLKRIEKLIMMCYGLRVPTSTIHEWLVDEREGQ